ncbi:MAG TPA: TonB-dependent copper receptor [Chromatiales bacterium]|nr:TonB-dependent copper receptor [Chromatiales bacterium]
MKNFSRPLLGLSICTAVMAAQADELPTILIEESVAINPNASEPDRYNRTRGLSSDGGEFLRQLNGVSTSRFGGRGLEPIIRGQSQTRLNILLDGAYVHGGCPNRMDPPASWAALETYEEVTVLKGVQSLIYGAGGSGGTVLFERDTRDLAEEKGIHGRVSVAGSDNGVQYDVLGDVVAAGEKTYLRAFAEIKDAENYQDGDGREVRSAYDHRQGGVILGLTPSDTQLFELTYERNDFEDALYPGAGMDSPEEKGNFYRLKYEDEFQTGWLDAIKLETYLNDVDHLMNNFSLRTPPVYTMGPNIGLPMKRETPTTSETTGGRLVMDSGAGKTNWQYGVDLQRNERDAVLNNVDSGQPVALSFMWPGVTIEQYGVFAEATTALSEKNRLKYGLRVDQVNYSADKADDKPVMASPNMAYTTYYGITATDDDETNIGGLLRFEKDLTQDLTLFAGLSRSVRTADATERYMNKWNSNASNRWVGNPGLESEKHHQIDLGVTQKTRRYEVNAVVFYDDVSDYILRDTARGQSGILQTDNAEIYRNVAAELSGVELDGNARLTDTLDLSASLAYVRASNTTDNDRPIAQTPPLNGKVQLDYSAENWGLGSRIRFADRQDRIDDLSKQEVGETAGWAVLDVYGNYRFNNTFSLRVGADNLLDKTYAEHSSRSNLLDPVAIKVNEPGRVVWLKMTAEF